MECTVPCHAIIDAITNRVIMVISSIIPMKIYGNLAAPTELKEVSIYVSSKELKAEKFSFLVVVWRNMMLVKFLNRIRSCFLNFEIQMTLHVLI